MGDESQGASPDQRRKEWLRRLAAELEKTEQFFPTNVLPDAEYPEWVLKVERELSAVLLPEAKTKDKGEMTSKRMGAILGHSCAMAVWTMEWGAHEENKKAETAALKSLADQTNGESEKTREKWRLDKWYLLLRTRKEGAVFERRSIV